MLPIVLVPRFQHHTADDFTFKPIFTVNRTVCIFRFWISHDFKHRSSCFTIVTGRPMMTSLISTFDATVWKCAWSVLYSVEQVHTMRSISECHLRCNCHQCNVSSFEPKSVQSQKLKHDAFKRQKNIHRLPTIQIPRKKSYQRTASCFHFWVKIMQLTVTLVTGLDWWSDIQH